MTWTFDCPPGTYRNERLLDRLYEYASRQPESFCPHGRGFACERCYPPLPFWRRLRARLADLWDDYRPRVHLGPCPNDWED